MPLLSRMGQVAIIVSLIVALPARAGTSSPPARSNTTRLAEVAITKAENAYNAAVQAAAAAEKAFAAAIAAANAAHKDEQAAKKDGWAGIRNPRDIFGSFRSAYFESLMEKYTPSELVEVSHFVRGLL